MNIKRHTTLCAAVGALAAASYAPSAHAASSEYVSIILDQTGSMLAAAGADSTRWAESIKAARSQIDSTATTVAYGIWTFKQDATQDGPKQLWPLASTDCAKAADFESFTSPTTGGVANFCRPTRAIDVGKVTTKLDSYATDPAQIPQPDWLTPLASSLCTMMETISTSALSGIKTFLFESDAGENVSSGLCAGDIDVLAPAAWSYTTVANSNEWGLTPASWEAKVVRKLYNFNLPLASAVASPLPNSSKTLFDARLAGFGVKWLVDVHYEMYPASNMLMATAAPSTSFAQLAPMTITDTGITQFLQAPSSPQRASAATTLLAAGTSTPSMNASELGFFKALGSAGPRSKFRELVTIPGTVFGVTHKLLGDVDDSGCTDQADLNIIKQRDVWLKRAVQPLQIAIRADVSRDGWVDQADVNVVVSHWAQGCINPVPAPKL